MLKNGSEDVGEADAAVMEVDLEKKKADDGSRVRKAELELNDLLECYSRLEAEYKECQDDWENAGKSVDMKERDLTCALLQVNNLEKRIEEIDEAYEICENKLKDTLDKLADCNRRADESGRTCHSLDKRAVSDEIRFMEFEKQVNELGMRSKEGEMKIDETVKSIGSLEENLEIVDVKVYKSKIKLFQLREEMQIMGNNLKSAQVSADKSRLQEMEFKRTIKSLGESVKKAEACAMNGEKHVEKLWSEIDKLEVDLQNEKEKLESLSFEMDATLSEFE